MKHNYIFRILVGLSLVLTFIAWLQGESLGVIFLPFVGIPTFLLAAFTTRFLMIKNKIISIPLGLVGLIAIVYAFFIVTAGMSTTTKGLFGEVSVTPSTTRVLSFIATLIFTVAEIVLWWNYIKSRKTNIQYRI